MQRVLAFVDLVMHAMHDSWSWDGWRCGDLHGPVDDTTNSCAVALLLIGLRLSRGVGVPIKWADGVLDLARDLFATHFLAPASFAPRWGGSPDGETFVVREVGRGRHTHAASWKGRSSVPSSTGALA